MKIGNISYHLTKLDKSIKNVISDVDRRGFCTESCCVIFEKDGMQLKIVACTDEDDFIEHDGEFLCIEEGK